MTYRARNIVVAVALAVVAALLTGFYVTNYKRTVQHGEKHVSVLVATKDIPAGTQGSALSSYVHVQQVARRNVVPGAISDVSQVNKYVAAQKTFAGEQVTTRRFTAPQNLGVRAQLTGNQRAISVSGNARQVLAGTLRAGDRVDLVINQSVPEKQNHHFDRVLLRDLLVLKAPEGGGPGGKLEGAQQDFAVMLRMTDTQSSKFWFAVNNTDGSKDGWSLMLRPVNKPEDSAENIEEVRTILFDGLNRYQVQRVGGNR
jgi:Flp pilus assembly protein CpaB